MKRLYLLAAFMVAMTIKAQSTNDMAIPPKTQSTNGLNLQALTMPQTPETTFILREPKPNEIIKGNVIYSGISIEIAKTHRPLQLLNPLAPPAYGSSEDNVVRDPINGRASGLKLFAIRF